MILTILIVSGFTSLGLAIYANHLYEDRAEVQERLNLVSDSYREALADMEAMRNAAPDIPAPACDPFLEVADLNNRIDQLIKEKYEIAALYASAVDERDAERRSNAALRGQITKLSKPKGKVK